MANVLAELFADIASEIKDKIGDNTPIKPLDFPKKIREISASGSDYNLRLAETLMMRNPKYMSGDGKTMNLRGFVMSDGGTLGNLPSYSFAGFENIESLILTDIMIICTHAFRDNKSLKILDITATKQLPNVSFQAGSLAGCDSLESIIIRCPEFPLQSMNQVTFLNDVNGFTNGKYNNHGSMSNFYVYVPSEYYDEIVANVNANVNTTVSASRYRKLEDYPDINYWNKTFTVKFYDGNELVRTLTTKYGETVSFNYSKEGYTFIRWSPEPVNVTENMECYAEWEVVES